MTGESEVMPSNVAKGVQVSAVVSAELVERIDDYRFNKQVKERSNVKRSDVIKSALEEFFAKSA